MVESVKNLYVIATLDTPTEYLFYDAIHHTYYFVQDIAKATKMPSRSIAKSVLEYYRLDTGMDEPEMVVVPLRVTYELLEESDEYIFR